MSLVCGKNTKLCPWSEKEFIKIFIRKLISTYPTNQVYQSTRKEHVDKLDYRISFKKFLSKNATSKKFLKARKNSVRLIKLSARSALFNKTDAALCGTIHMWHLPSPSLSKREKASLNSAICSSVLTEEEKRRVARKTFVLEHEYWAHEYATFVDEWKNNVIFRCYSSVRRDNRWGRGSRLHVQLISHIENVCLDVFECCVMFSTSTFFTCRKTV